MKGRKMKGRSGGGRGGRRGGEEGRRREEEGGGEDEDEEGGGGGRTMTTTTTLIMTVFGTGDYHHGCGIDVQEKVEKRNGKGEEVKGGSWQENKTGQNGTGNEEDEVKIFPYSDNKTT